MNYHDYIKQHVALSESAKKLNPEINQVNVQIGNKKKVLLFSPHPDDEAITGGLAIRLALDEEYEVINIPVTYGSNIERIEERKKELRSACFHLGFAIQDLADNGFSNVNLQSKSDNPQQWAAYTKVIAAALAHYRPSVIVFPHADDQHPTHIGVHHLVMDALNALSPQFDLILIETEFWRAMRRANVMIESSESEVATLVEAIACHEGEVKRNPYHLTQIAWMADNVRRGSELLSGYGKSAHAIRFATLYRKSLWTSGQHELIDDEQLFIGEHDCIKNII